VTSHYWCPVYVHVESDITGVYETPLELL
jgi:hypothetical protein